MASPLLADVRDDMPSDDDEIPAAAPAESKPAPQPSPPYERRVNALPTLPSVTLRQHRIAAIAGGGVTLLALCGFAALIALAPREPRIRAFERPAADTTSSIEPVAAPAEEPAPVPQLSVLPVVAPATASVDGLPVAPVVQPDAPASAQAPALAEDSPRWGDMTDDAEAKAEAMTSEGVAETVSPDIVRSIPDTDDVIPLPAVREGDQTDTSGDEIDPAAIEPDRARPEPAAPDNTVTAAIPRADPADARPGRVTKHVNLRSRPDDDAKVLRVVPAKASLSVLDCKSWCEVVYEGTRGYVYKSFVK